MKRPTANDSEQIAKRGRSHTVSTQIVLGIIFPDGLLANLLD